MTMMTKSFFVAAGLVALVSSAAIAAPALATRDLTVRAQPAGAAAIVGRIPGGSTVDASNCGQVWCRVTWAQLSGYVIRNYLDIDDEDGPPPGYGAYGPPVPPAYYGPPPPAYGPPPPLYPYGYYGPYGRPWYRW